MKVSVAVLLGVAGGALLLTGCAGGQSGSTATGSGSPQVFNEADVNFAERMIVHHQQAILMADLTKERAGSPQVKQLATQIAAEQQPEIATMSGWLRAWGKLAPGATTGTASPVPSAGGMPTMMPSAGGMPTMMPSAGGMPTIMPSAGGMPTMMPSVTPQPGMSQMMQMHGAEFDRMFLQMMIAHHEGAVAMAKTEQASGANPQAKQLAKNIETSQTAQIAQMQQMLQSPSAHHS
jgi:uncharacterized protein (DUF305 family)